MEQPDEALKRIGKCESNQLPTILRNFEQKVNKSLPKIIITVSATEINDCNTTELNSSSD